MIKHQHSLRLPTISKKQMVDINNSTRGIDNKFTNDDENDRAEVNKLQEWAMNKPKNKTKSINSHNISFLYKKDVKISHIQKNSNLASRHMEISLYVPKIDFDLKKIGDINYFSIFKNMEYCSGVYANQFNGILKTLQKYKSTVKNELQQQYKKLSVQREKHLQKIHQLQETTNSDYKHQIQQVRQNLQEKQKTIKPLKKVLKNLQNAKIKVLKFCLALGYDVRQDGLIWIIKQLGEIPKVQQFPQFLSQREKMFIINKYKNQIQIQQNQKQKTLKTQICGKTINEAYEFMNRRKRRELSLIKQNQEMLKLYAQKIKDYSPDNHKYLYDATLQIAQNLQKQKAKPTKYQIIYNQTVKKLNRICREQIYEHQRQKQDKQNKGKNDPFVKRKPQRNTTLIIEQFSKMLNESIGKTKKNQDLRSMEEKQLEEILREIRIQKYNKQNIYAQRNLHEHDARNPVSILSCLMGWKKSKKIIEQEMMNF